MKIYEKLQSALKQHLISRPQYQALLQLFQEELSSSSSSSSWTPASTPFPSLRHFPQQIGPYLLLKAIGQGGMGIIYQVRHSQNEKEYALKMLIQADSPEYRIRFQNEARLITRLQHPGIVQIHDYGEYEGIPYLVLDYVSGSSLAELLKEAGSFPLKKTLQWGIQICMALDYAHQQGVIHRDIKPANLLLSPSGVPQLVDFGVAKNLQYDLEQTKLTQTGQILGTPAYLAPELLLDPPRPVAPTTDIYSLGVTLYELLTGHLPYRGKNSLEILDQIRSRPPLSPRLYSPNLPLQVEQILLKCLRRDPQQRYPSALALGKDISFFLSEVPLERPSKFQWWEEKKGGLEKLFLCLSVVGGIFFLYRWYQQDQEKFQILLKDFQRVQEEAKKAQESREEALQIERRDVFLQKFRWKEKAQNFQDDLQKSYREKNLLEKRCHELEKAILLLKQEWKGNPTQQRQETLHFQKHYAMALFALEEKEEEKALEIFKALHGSSPVALALFQEAQLLEKRRAWNEALEVYAQIPDPYQGVASWKSFQIALEHQQDEVKAQEYFQQLQQLLPESVWQSHALAALLFHQKEYSALSQMLVNTPYPSLYFTYLKGLFSLEFLPQSSLEGSIPLDSESGKKALEKAVSLHPEKSLYRFTWALHLFFEKKYEEALSFFSHRVDEDFSWRETQDVLLFLCLLFSNKEEPAKALLPLVSLRSEDGGALYAQGKYYRETQQQSPLAFSLLNSALEKTQQHLQQKNFRFPGDGVWNRWLLKEIQYEQANLLLRQGKWKQASWIMDQLLKDDPRSQRAFLGLGQSLWFQGAESQTYDYFKKASDVLEGKQIETYLWNLYYLLYFQPERISKGFWSEERKIPQRWYSLAMVFKALSVLEEGSFEIQKETDLGFSPDPWLKDLLAYFRGEASGESLQVSSSQEKARLFFYLGLYWHLQRKKEQATVYFLKSFETQEVGIEEHFMAWLALGGLAFTTE
jgi:serine/threonine protein kinase